MKWSFYIAHHFNLVEQLSWRRDPRAREFSNLNIHTLSPIFHCVSYRQSTHTKICIKSYFFRTQALGSGISISSVEIVTAFFRKAEGRALTEGLLINCSSRLFEEVLLVGFLKSEVYNWSLSRMPHINIILYSIYHTLVYSGMERWWEIEGN